jgi:serine/threonine-protein kinase HipA
MSFRPTERLTVSYEPEEGRRLTVGRLARKRHEILFEYDAAFLKLGLQLSPFKLPLREGVTVGDPSLFDGLMGVFDDSLPDGWGRLLIDRRAAKAGIAPRQMGPLDRLALIGARSMGALVYEPSVGLTPPSVVSLPDISADAQAVVRDAKVTDLDRLVALGGSPQGARPKVLVQLSADGTVTYGSTQAIAGASAWLVKFRSAVDAPHVATLEYAYMKMAKAAGIDVPHTRMLCRTRGEPGYFATQRFDRDGKRKHHMLTLAGLLDAPHTRPTLTYQQLLEVTRALTSDETAVAEMFRRACFNVFAHNRDDHTRNFAFLMSDRGQWRPAPAYDITFSTGPAGEH